VVKQLENEAAAVDDLIADILNYSVEEREFFKAGRDYVIDGEIYTLSEVIEDDPVVLIFLSKTGRRVDITPYSEAIIHEQA
jgi:hypothetical protein